MMNMQTNSHVDSYFINAFHRQNSMAVQREAMRMSLHPCSREQKLAQIQSLKEKTTSKDSANAERRKLAL